MQFTNRLTLFAIESPEVVKKILIILTALLGVFIFRIDVDTNPENMLSEDEFVRTFHSATKLEFNLNDYVIVGIVNEKNYDGIFNPETLKKINIISKFATTLIDKKDPLRYVVSQDIIAPDNVETITAAGPGKINFNWLMTTPPNTREECLKIKAKAMKSPFLKGNMISEDGKAIALYIPITQQSYAREVSDKLHKKLQELKKGTDQFYITGLPLAGNVFSKKMFSQMVIFVPVTMLFIFLFLLLFFKHPNLTIAPIIISLITIICTMGLLIGSGNSLHIISSMIPIFLIPITMIGSIYILSEFYDDYQKMLDRRRTIIHVMNKLSSPMLYTTLITAAGFGSLTLTQIPPLKIFGIFIAIGIILSWFITVLFIPAHIITIREEKFIHFGNKNLVSSENDNSLLHRHLRLTGKIVHSSPGLILAITIIIITISIIGINRIQLYNYDTNWLNQSQQTPEADAILNRHLPGTYKAYLVLDGKKQRDNLAKAAAWIRWKIGKKLRNDNKILLIALSQLDEAIAVSDNENEMYHEILQLWQSEYSHAKSDADAKSWARALDALSPFKHRKQLFKRSDILNYISSLQDYLVKQNNIGKTYSIADLVKKLHQEIFDGNPKYYSIPIGSPAVSKTLDHLDGSKKTSKISHFVSPDFKKTVIHIQLKNNNNKEIEKLIANVNSFIKENPPPETMEVNWAGLTYVNSVWLNTITDAIQKSFIIVQKVFILVQR